MAVRLLLDAHIGPLVARLLREKGLDVESLAAWHGGHYRTAPDADILSVADLERRTLVTYDVSSVSTLIRRWAEAAMEHSGVIFVSRKTVRQGDVGGLVGALERTLLSLEATELRNQVRFLEK